MRVPTRLVPGQALVRLASPLQQINHTVTFPAACQWLSREQVRLCSGQPKVHFGTIVEGSWEGGDGCTEGPPDFLTICIYVCL